MSEIYFESKRSRERAEYMLETYDCPDLLKEQSEASLLDGFIDNYNWDDGLEIPYFILKHVNCELGTALKIFYLAEGTEMLKTGYQDYQLGNWVEFIEYAFQRIAEGNYSSKLISFQFPLNRVSKMKIKKAGWPNLFIEDIVV